MQNNCSLISYFRFLNFFLTCSKRNLTSKTIRKTYPTDSQSRLLLTRFNNFWDYLCCVEETVVNITPMLSPSLSAPGFDGRTWETLKEVFQENEGVLLKYVQCITKVSLPECMQDYLALAKIIPLAKKSTLGYSLKWNHICSICDTHCNSLGMNKRMRSMLTRCHGQIHKSICWANTILCQDEKRARRDATYVQNHEGSES
mmetsp:Transcript_35099/g.83274  ORF Transcript_35099/g.83274 Transcript_35099/m.83274 type:complete len:201 (-) Transcript_35099:1361-1963(-)